MTRRSRILAVGPLPPPRGGATINFETFVAEVHERASALGVDSLRVTDTSPRVLRTTHELAGGPLRNMARVAGTLSLAPWRRESIVFFASERYFLACAPTLLAARVARLPVVVKFVGQALGDFLRERGPASRVAMCAALSRMTAVLCQTEMMLEEARGFGVRNAKLGPGYRRVDWSSLPPLREENRGTGLRLIHLGLVSKDKGAHDVIRALGILHRADVTLDLFGDVPGDEQSEFEGLLKNAPNVRHHGVFDGDPVSLLGRFDALVLATTHRGEGHPGVVIEAMAAGIPVLVTRYRALPELVDDGQNGLLVPPHDVDAIAAAVVRLADRPEERLRMGRAHRARLARHDARHSVEAILALLDEG